MIGWRNVVGLTLLSGGLLLAAMSPNVLAATSSAPDMLSNDRAGDADSVDLGSVKPIIRPNRDAPKPQASGNPLWSVPLSVLTATQERPIFSASRRPPPRAVVAPPVEQPAVPPPPLASVPEPPPLALIGAVVGDSDAIAVFVDRTTQKMVRLRQGESHAGWVLDTVLRREVTLKKDERSETIELKSTTVSGAPVLPMPTAIGAGPVAPGTLIPAAATAPGGVMDSNYAPFTPRSTPKNGESDGL
jgi:general secretion pathway protein N